MSKIIDKFIEEATDCLYVSFDIFDTLIKRNINVPSDVFKLVEREYNKDSKKNVSNFATNRIAAETKAREAFAEVTLDEIYMNMDQYDTRTKDELKRLEEQIELDLCQFNEDIRDIYEWAINNKKVIITSDMYLSKKVISNILKNNGICYDKLYVSSEYKLRKKDGKIFEYILADLKIKPFDIIHIGDNKNSDYLSPLSHGINSVLYINKTNNHLKKKKNIDDDLDYNILCSFLKNNAVENSDYFYNVGYECFGPFLYAFTIWLINELKKDKISKVFFLARDGKIIQEAFKLINEDSNIKDSYFFASRRSIIVPSFCKASSVEQIFNSFNIPKYITLKDLQKRLGLDDIDITPYIRNYGLELNKKYNFKYLMDNYSLFFEELFPYIIENSKNEYKYFMKYKDRLDFNGKVAIVDIGWLGNMQNALEKICKNDTDIIGYYLGLRHDKIKNIQSKGFMFDVKKNRELEEREMYFNSIFEFVFTSLDGSTKRFSNVDGGVEFYESENINPYEKNAIIGVQTGALDFIKKIKSSAVCKYINLNEYNAFYNFFNLLFKPSIEDANMFGELKFLDGTIYQLAKKDKIFKIQSFKDSLWKIGYMRRNSFISLPFDKIYMIIQKVKKIRK